MQVAGGESSSRTVLQLLLGLAQGLGATGWALNRLSFGSSRCWVKNHFILVLGCGFLRHRVAFCPPSSSMSESPGLFSSIQSLSPRAFALPQFLWQRLGSTA